MELHRTTGRTGLGLALAGTTVLLWGMLPLALKGVLAQMDPLTINWYRFAAAALALGGALAWRGELPAWRTLGRSQWVLLAVATVFLGVNYVGYILGLNWTTAADAQVVIQIAPIMLAVGGIVVFGERFTRIQWCGFGVLLLGLGIFFSGRLGSLIAGMDRFWLGNATIVFAALTWSVYGLAQKQLLHRMGSQQVMWCIYLGCAVAFAPTARPGAIGDLDSVGLALLGFCAANTVIAYGSFSEALQHWEASRVSAVLALTPLATLCFSALADRWWPELQGDAPLSWTSLAGAGVVVAGSMLTALGGRRSGSEDP